MGKERYAEDLNFWMSGKSSPDVWIDRTKRQIQQLGGKPRGEAFGSDGEGRAAFMLMFEIETEQFKIVWPVLKSKNGHEAAAKVQAATTLYHYVKAVCLYAVVVGVRAAFFTHLMLPDGRTASQVATPELSAMTPKMLTGHTL